MNSKNILVTGGTGFLGRALVGTWLAQGHRLTVLSRNPLIASHLLPPQVHTIADLNLLPAAGHFDAIVNLAGEPIFDGRWSESRKKQIRDSRIILTNKLVSYIADRPVKPEVLISGSAIGVYGNQGDNILTENSHEEIDFAQQLCADWENTALEAENSGVRVCRIRTGLVLDNGGGLLAKMLPAFKLGLGGRLGDGKQWMSWIHRRDWLAIVDLLLNNPELRGAFNATAPHPVTNSEFTACLAKQLRRPALLPIPASALKLLLGEMSELVLGSQRVIPKRLLDQGFEFQFPTLESALQQILPHK